MTYSFSEKLACVRRELGMRKRVYTRWVQEGRMKADMAAREIGLMEDILDDYERLAERERLL